MLEEGFELELEAGLTPDRVFVGLAGALEENALIVGGLPDGPVFVEAQEAGQRKGIPAVIGRHGPGDVLDGVPAAIPRALRERCQ
jgi:hypothetical protein